MNEGTPLERTGWLSRACPCCGDTGVTQEIVRAVRPAERLSYPEVRKHFIGVQTDGCFFTYVRCQHCGQLYAPVFFNQAQLDECYSDMPPNDSGQGERGLLETQDRYASQILEEGPPTRRILELGADYGFLASALAARTPTSQYCAVEPNRSAWEALRSHGVGFASTQIVPGIADVLGNFDAIIAVHVVDHLLEPLRTLAQLRNLMHPEGRMFIVVHDEASLLRKLMRRAWPPFCLQHPQVYSNASMVALADQARLEVVKSWRTMNTISLRRTASLLLRRVGLSRYTNLIPDVHLQVALGNRMYVLSSAGQSSPDSTLVVS